MDLDADTYDKEWSEWGASYLFARDKQSLNKGEVILVSAPEVLGETGKHQILHLQMSDAYRIRWLLSTEQKSGTCRNRHQVNAGIVSRL